MIAATLVLLMNPLTFNPTHSHLSRLELQRWGTESLADIDKAYWSPALGRYAQKPSVTDSETRASAFCWDLGVQLSALTSAAHVDPVRYLPRLKRLVSTIEPYINFSNGVRGLSVLPNLNNPDRFYDDNAWIAIAMADAYSLNPDTKWLSLCKIALDFALSGEDFKLGGGIYWREREKASKNTCSNAPTAVAALNYYLITHDLKYLHTANRLLNWTQKTLQDGDGLYFDNIHLDGTLDKTKWSYNTALMIEGEVLRYEITKDSKHLNEAKRVAIVAANRWVNAKTGALKDDGSFAHLLCDAWLRLARHDSDPRWPKLVHAALAYVHNNVHATDGHYAKRWDTAPAAEDSKILLDQASVARAYWQSVREWKSEK